MNAVHRAPVAADDAVEIWDVLATYAHCIDNRDWDRLCLVFTTDVEFGTPGNYTASRDQIPAIIESVNPYHPHYTTDTVLHRLPDDSSGRAQARSWSKYVIIRHDGSIASGDYLDRWVHTEQGWRIAQRRISRGLRWEHDPGGSSQRELRFGDFLEPVR